ncbi:sentrin-specific protease 2 [Hordeum vulgare]|nr:sentrin-specific protease 2 [Hordeum vulgare]
MGILVKRTTTITRVMDEYFNTDKAYFPMNVNGNHWIIVLMHNTKKEFQVLNSLGPVDRNIRKTIHTLKAQIAIDIAAANKQVESKFPDVSTWLIVEYEMPKQTDGVSCMLFVLRCIEYWDGEKWTPTFDQDEINESRSKILAELIFSEDNIVEKVKNEVLRLISRD